MNKVLINFTNCYGIKKLQHEFDFSSGKNYILYASNGMMKTSFTKTFKDLSLGKKPSDCIFSRETMFEVNVDDNPIKKENIFVINSYEDEYISPNSAKLMVNKELRQKYDEASEKVLYAKNFLFSELAEIGKSSDEGMPSVLLSR